MSEIRITSENFDKEVLKSEVPVLLDLWASWCGPCRMMEPVISRIAEKYKDTLKVGKINVDEEPGLAARFNVSAIPMIVIMKKGEVTSSALGYRPAEAIEQLL